MVSLVLKLIDYKFHDRDLGLHLFIPIKETTGGSSLWAFTCYTWYTVQHYKLNSQILMKHTNNKSQRLNDPAQQRGWTGLVTSFCLIIRCQIYICSLNALCYKHTRIHLNFFYPGFTWKELLKVLPPLVKHGVYSIFKLRHTWQHFGLDHVLISKQRLTEKKGAWMDMWVKWLASPPPA